MESTEPLTETTFYILLSLAPHPKHGYAIMKDVQHMSYQRVILSTGTLYGALKRLLELGWIVRAEDPKANENGRVRNVYALSETGQSILQAEVRRLDHMVSTARRHSWRQTQT
jgi:DNA-binding PadR family transcriptional regulator